MSKSIKKKVKIIYHKVIHKTRELFKWFKIYYNFGLSLKFNTICTAFFYFFNLLLKIGTFISILYFSGIIKFEEGHIFDINDSYQSKYITETGLLGAQITLTLISVSLIALISNTDNKYIFGNRLVNTAFSSKGPFSFKCRMSYLFVLLFLNVFFMTQNVSFSYVLIVFFISLFLSVGILEKFGMVFLNRNYIKRKLKSKYYKCNLKYMRKEKPIYHYFSQPLVELKDITLKHILYNSIPELNENMQLYFDVMKITLFNKPQIVQEFYTECGNKNDIIGGIIDLSEAMLHQGQPIYGIRTYVALLKNLNYFKINGLTEILTISPVDTFIKAFNDINNRIHCKTYLSYLLAMNAALIEQANLKVTTDLSYCRLAKHDLIHSHINSNFYEKIYDVIKKSTFLTAEEKDELFDHIRSNIISLFCENLYNDIDCFRNHKNFKKDERNLSLEIKAEPFARYLLRLIENNELFHLSQLSYLGMDNISAAFAKILATLSVLNMVYKGNRREYLYDVNIDVHAVKELYSKHDFLNVAVKGDELKKCYELILKCYTKGAGSKNTYSNGGVYGFNPKFNFDKIVVDSYFTYLTWKEQTNKDVIEVAKENQFLIDDELLRNFSFVD